MLTEPEGALCYSDRESGDSGSLLETPIEACRPDSEVILPVPGARCHFRAAPPSRSAAAARTPRNSPLPDSTTCRSLGPGRVDSEPRAELPVGESDPSRPGASRRMAGDGHG